MGGGVPSILVPHLIFSFCLYIRYDLSLLSEDNLQKDLGIRNSIHRKIILDAVAAREAQQSGIIFGDHGEIFNKSTFTKSIDAFISYRRSNGSQLARYFSHTIEWWLWGG